jgi:hypothetical protein
MPSGPAPCPVVARSGLVTLRHLVSTLHASVAQAQGMNYLELRGSRTAEVDVYRKKFYITGMVLAA